MVYWFPNQNPKTKIRMRTFVFPNIRTSCRQWSVDLWSIQFSKNCKHENRLPVSIFNDSGIGNHGNSSFNASPLVLRQIPVCRRGASVVPRPRRLVLFPCATPLTLTLDSTELWPLPSSYVYSGAIAWQVRCCSSCALSVACWPLYKTSADRWSGKRCSSRR